MNGRDRILATFRGEKADTVPFAPNIYQWFYHHQFKGSLPAELAGATHPFDVLRHLGADILARWDTEGVTRIIYNDGDFSETYAGHSNCPQPLVTAFNTYPPHKTEYRSEFVTPYGTLSRNWRLSVEAGADFEVKHWWTRWDEYEAVRFMLEATDYAVDEAGFRYWVERVADDGVVMLNLTQSPLKTLHKLAGAENATFFMMDHPEEIKALVQIHTKKALVLLEKVVDNSDVAVFVYLDNLDSMFYPPYFYRDYCDEFFTRAAEIIHSRNKILVVHACGRNKVLLPLVGQSKIDCLEGITPPPMGDVHLDEVRALSGYANFTVNGGMDALHQEISDDAKDRLHQYTRELFESMGDKRHFIFASSCNTSPLTPWENIKYFRDAAREFGVIK